MNNRKLIIILFVLVLAVFFSGCATTGVSEQDRAAARRALELENIRADLDRIQGRLDGIDKSQQYIDSRLVQLENANQMNVKNMKAELEQLRIQVSALEKTRGKLRQDIIADISAKVGKLMKSQSSSTPVGDTGYEHVVKPGETLSVIAQAYGVKVNVIVNANNIEDPDNVRAGTKLFIPQ